MGIDTPLFQGKLVRLAPIDHEKDPEIISRWTHSSEFMRMAYTEPARPQSPWQVKKTLENLEKSLEENKNQIYLMIHTLADDRLIGFVEIYWIGWSNGTGNLRLGFGDPQDWRKGYGRDTLQVIHHYAFRELNLHRLSAVIPEYNQAALALFGGAGYLLEARRRSALDRDGRRWDSLIYGLLIDEWRGSEK